MTKGLKLTDILVTNMICYCIWHCLYLWGSVYYALKPIGLHADQFMYGMWLIASTVAFLIIRKPGVALLAEEIPTASGELLLVHPWGLTVLLYGVVQGLFAELVFMTFKYKRFHISVVILSAGIAACLGSVLMDFAYGEIGELRKLLGI